MCARGEAQERAARVYDSAADTYDSAANSYWTRFGRRTVERLRLVPGARVLDVCCGSGASALPAAELVGPQGSVLGVDLSNNLLALARAKAARAGLSQAEFRIGDLLNLGLEGASFDAVVCVFGIFFVAEIPLAVNELWKRVRPGGALAITTWGPRLFEPVDGFFWSAVRGLRPDLDRVFQPWDRLSEPESLRSTLVDGGVPEAEIEIESGVHPLTTAEDAWSVVMGSGYRGTVDQLTPEQREQVRTETLAATRRASVREVETNVVYAIAHKRL